MRKVHIYEKTVCEDIYLDGCKEYGDGNKKRAFRLFLKAAQLGDPHAQNRVGVCYDTGEGVRKDRGLALYWYKKSVKYGTDTSAFNNIASLYASEGNSRRAVYWWSKAVHKDDGDAMVDLARFYLFGRWMPPYMWDDVELDPAILNKKIVVRKAAKLLKSAQKSSHITPAAAEEAEFLLNALK